MDKGSLKSQIENEIENLERLIKENKAITKRFIDNLNDDMKSKL